MQDDSSRPVACHFCRATDPPSLDPVVMVKSLAYQLACHSPGSALAEPMQQHLLGMCCTTSHSCTARVACCACSGT